MTVLSLLALLDQIVPVVTLAFNYYKLKSSKDHLAATAQNATVTGQGGQGQPPKS
jgi:hypothetical protein